LGDSWSEDRIKLALWVAGFAGILLGALLLGGFAPLETLSILVKGSLGSPAAISGTLRETTPLLLAGLAVFIALRAGLFNIGAEGQFVMGALASAVVALRIPTPIGLVLALVSGVLAGALWALPAALIKAYRNGHEVISTIMLNNIAGFMTTYLVSGILKDPAQESLTTVRIADSVKLPNLIASPPFFINFGLLIGVVAVVLSAWWLQKTVSGYELQAAGANPVTARFAGVNVPREIVRAMLVSGGLAGFAGAVQVLAFEGRFYANFSPGYGFDALGVALLAGGSSFGTLPAAFLFGVLAKGGTALQISSVPKGLTTVLLGILIFVAAAIRYRKERPVD
jgi:general nucleoside transport system permease protein